MSQQSPVRRQSGPQNCSATARGNIFDGTYVLHATKGWRRISPRRMQIRSAHDAIHDLVHRARKYKKSLK